MVKLLLVTVLTIVNIPNPFYGDAQGAYYYGTGFYWCNYRAACIHEIGHKLDDRGGMISQSQDFVQAIQELTIQDEWLEYIQSFPADVAFPAYENRNMELYASLYARANGSPVGFPLSLMKFYDWNYGSQEIKSLTIKD